MADVFYVLRWQSEAATVLSDGVMPLEKFPDFIPKRPRAPLAAAIQKLATEVGSHLCIPNMLAVKSSRRRTFPSAKSKALGWIG